MSDHEDETKIEDNSHSKIVPQITTVTNITAKFPYLKKGDAKSMTTDQDDEHMGDFYHMIDARDIWNAIKARFGRNAESKKMQKSLLKQRDSVSAGDVVADALANEEKIRVLSYELEEKSNILVYRQILIDQAAQEKQDLMTKLDIEIANQAKWNNSCQNLYKLIDSSMSVRIKRGLRLHKYIGEDELGINDSKLSIFHTNTDDLEGQPIYNRFASVDHMKAIPPPLTGNYMPPFNIPDIDESHMVYGKKANDSSEIKSNDDNTSHSNDSVFFDFSDRSLEPSTNDFQMCDSSQECSRPNHSDHDSNSSVSAPTSESSDTIVIECAKQEDFPSVCTSSIETDVRYSKTLCNKFGSFNKESYFRKHKSCYVCGSYLHLIKYCDLHEQRLVKRHAKGKGILKSKPIGKPVNPNRTKPVSAGRPKPVFAGRPNPISAGRPNPVSAVQPNPVSAGQPNTVSAGDGILGPRPLNIQPKSTYSHSFTHNNQQIIFLITHNSLYLLYLTGGLNGKTVVKPSAGWPWTKYGIAALIKGRLMPEGRLMHKGRHMVLNCPTFKLEEIVMAMMTCLKLSGVHYQCFTVKCGLLHCKNAWVTGRLVTIHEYSLTWSWKQFKQWFLLHVDVPADCYVIPTGGLLLTLMVLASL
nr:xylulose kinase-1 [Tanacetum cinerariifolium]